jgi:sugar phosphate isomerase/epimerase
VIGLNFITFLAMPPLEMVALAAELEVRDLSMGLAPFTANPHHYPGWSMREDAGLRRDFVAACDAEAMTVSIGEFFLIRPGADVVDAKRDFAQFAEIGTQRVNALSIDPDLSRTIDQLGIFAELAAANGMGATLEYMAGAAIGTLDQALAAVDRVGRSDLTLMLDCLHFARSGGEPQQLAAVDPAKIAYLQLCDASAGPPDARYGDDALHNRLAPSDGELPLAAILAAIPPATPIGLEIPMRSKAEAEVSPRTYIGDAVAKARALLGETGGKRDT